MEKIIIRNMTSDDEPYCFSCGHVNESAEWTNSQNRRKQWFYSNNENDLIIKTAVLKSKIIGFLYLLPIEKAPFGPLGENLLVIQCLAIRNNYRNLGAGKLLIASAEEEALNQRKNGIVVVGYFHDFWFMPATFFIKCNYKIVKRKKNVAILWKTFSKKAKKPYFMISKYKFKEKKNKVVVDLFWTHSCLTTDTEAQNVREVVSEFNDNVILNDYCTDDIGLRNKYCVSRGIYINGKSISWGYEAPKNGIRDAIKKELIKLKS